MFCFVLFDCINDVLFNSISDMLITYITGIAFSLFPKALGARVDAILDDQTIKIS